jgi:5-(carboxyamino)imidazole ribonucleotide synthase
MLAMAAYRLGFRTHIYADEGGPAFDVTARSTTGSYDDLERIATFAQSVDVVTYEFENVPVAAAYHAQRWAPVRPGPRALAVAQDRLQEKQFAWELGLAVHPFAPVDSEADLRSALATIGTPAVLKTRHLGYDGKGQARIAALQDAAAALASIGRHSAILESLVTFAFEVSVLTVRGVAGEIVHYDVPRNEHAGGILSRSTVPSLLPAEHVAEACRIGARAADALDYVGVLTVELFYCPGAKDHFLVNEFAPRVHNSGHWTLDACHVSQFENHIRAIAGWPLGSVERHSDAEMLNLIGADVLDWQRIAADPTTALHIYGKNDPRAGRKMGHLTRLSPRRAHRAAK